MDKPSQPPEPQPSREALLRADERQRIAREVHDSTSQLLVVLQLELGRLRRLGNPEAAPLIDECEKVLKEMHESIRALGLG